MLYKKFLTQFSAYIKIISLSISLVSSPLALSANQSYVVNGPYTVTLTVDSPRGLDDQMDVSIKYFVNRDAEALANSYDVILIPGLMATAPFFYPLARDFWGKEYREDYGTNPAQPNALAIKRFFIVELPGHGASEEPDDQQYGSLTVDDYQEVLWQVLKQLPSIEADDYGQAMSPLNLKILGCHSMGCILTQMLAQHASSGGTSLKELFNIQALFSMGSTPPAETSWVYAYGEDNVFDMQDYTSILTEYLNMIAVTVKDGLFLLPTPEQWQHFMFSIDASETDIAANTPDEEEILEEELISQEAYAVATTMLGYDLQTIEQEERLARPSIDKGVFKDFLFAMVSFQWDKFFIFNETNAEADSRQYEQEELFAHLVDLDAYEVAITVDCNNDYRTERFIYHEYCGDDAVHGVPYANPRAVTTVLNDLVGLLTAQDSSKYKKKLQATKASRSSNR